MNNLINKYQDGELSQEEIVRLHQAISSSELVRRKMLLASVLRDTIETEKANIKMPEEFFTQVEDDILMRYLKEVPAEQTNFVLGRNKKPVHTYYTALNRTLRYAATIAILLFGVFYSISEFNFNMPSTQSAENMNDLQAATTENNTSEKSTAAPEQNSNIAANANSTTTNNINTTATSTSTATANTTTENVLMASIELMDKTDVVNELPMAQVYSLKSEKPENIKNGDGQETIVLAEITRSANMAEPVFAQAVMRPIAINDAEKSDSPKNGLPIAMASISRKNLEEVPQFKIEKNTLTHINMPELLGSQLSYGNDFGNSTPLTFLSHGAIMTNSFGTKTNPDKIAVTFAQSIGFESDNTRHGAGFEFGYSQVALYTYKEVILPDPAPKTGGAGIESPGPGNNNVDGTRTLLRSEYESSLFFGNIYYEYDIIRFENTQLTGRVGIGLCGSEPLGVIKLYGKQRIYNNLFMTLGFENRTFGLDVIGMQGDRYLSMFNFIYGVQIEL